MSLNRDQVLKRGYDIYLLQPFQGLVLSDQGTDVRYDSITESTFVDAEKHIYFFIFFYSMQYWII